jgi:hypothetical protein
MEARLWGDVDVRHDRMRGLGKTALTSGPHGRWRWRLGRARALGFGGGGWAALRRAGRTRAWAGAQRGRGRCGLGLLGRGREAGHGKGALGHKKGRVGGPREAFPFLCFSFSCSISCYQIYLQ